MMIISTVRQVSVETQKALDSFELELPNLSVQNTLPELSDYRLLNAKEAAQILGVNSKTIYTWASDIGLPFIRTGVGSKGRWRVPLLAVKRYTITGKWTPLEL